VTVGLTDHFDEAMTTLSEEAGPQQPFSDVVRGDIIIVLAQFFVALKVLTEKNIVAPYNVSLCLFLNNLP
jgi:hypothetical protein